MRHHRGDRDVGMRAVFGDGGIEDMLSPAEFRIEEDVRSVERDVLLERPRGAPVVYEAAIRAVVAAAGPLSTATNRRSSVTLNS